MCVTFGRKLRRLRRLHFGPARRWSKRGGRHSASLWFSAWKTLSIGCQSPPPVRDARPPVYEDWPSRRSACVILSGELRCDGLTVSPTNRPPIRRHMMTAYHQPWGLKPTLSWICSLPQSVGCFEGKTTIWRLSRSKLTTDRLFS